MNVKNIVLLSWVFLFVLGCATGEQKEARSSVVDYLYPGKDKKVIEPSIPVLKLPVRLGVAFVPEDNTRHYNYGFWNNTEWKSGLTETKKNEILAKIASHFKKYSFIGEIQEIPSNYLTPGGSFTNLDQIKTMYGIDVIALVSHDQVQFTDEGVLSFSYWTIVGAYVVAGEKNDTNTLMDTVVYDINSRKMLFRAPGTSLIKGRSTLVNLSEELRVDSAKGFDIASENMIKNLDDQLGVFREKIKQNPEQVKVEHTATYSGGGGSVDMGLLLFLFGLGVTCLYGRCKIGHH